MAATLAPPAAAAAAVAATKVYGHGEAAVVALDEVTVDLPAGRFTAVMGPSGSGKSTLLHCLAGLDRLTAGTVLVDGVDLSGLSDKALTLLRRERIGFVFQSFNLFPHLTALGNVMLGLLKVRHMAKREAQALAMTWLARVGLDDRASHLPSQLSGGQQQRVAIARALAMDPKLVLLDEITSALDPELVGEVLNTIKLLAEEGTTMLIVTHEMRFARDVAHRTIFMDGGLIAEQGPSAKLFRNPQNARLKEFLKRANM
jgi:polar amino acid transport system ATP-binding protein